MYTGHTLEILSLLHSLALWWYGTVKYAGLVSKNTKGLCPVPCTWFEFHTETKGQCMWYVICWQCGKWGCPRDNVTSQAKSDLVRPQRKRLLHQSKSPDRYMRHVIKHTSTYCVWMLCINQDNEGWGCTSLYEHMAQHKLVFTAEVTSRNHPLHR